MESWSRIEPPGCTTATTPALAASSMLSRKGKNASDARTLPRTRPPALRQPIRRVAVARGDDALDEVPRLRDLLGGRLVHLAVEAEHPAVGAERVAVVGAQERFAQAGGDRSAAGVVVLDDHRGGVGELAHQ